MIQTGALSVSGTSAFNAGSGAITLSNAGNAFNSPVSLTGGDTQLTNNVDTTLGTVNTGALTVNSGARSTRHRYRCRQSQRVQQRRHDPNGRLVGHWHQHAQCG